MLLLTVLLSCSTATTEPATYTDTTTTIVQWQAPNMVGRWQRVYQDISNEWWYNWLDFNTTTCIETKQSVSGGGIYTIGTYTYSVPAANQLKFNNTTHNVLIVEHVYLRFVDLGQRFDKL